MVGRGALWQAAAESLAALEPDLTARLPRRYAAQDAGANEQQLRDLAAEALGEVYFRDGGRRATGLAVRFTDIEHVEFDL
ncbi:hypothetical protein GCM10027162_12510 [Streptomyces incanus]